MLLRSHHLQDLIRVANAPAARHGPIPLYELREHGRLGQGIYLPVDSRGHLDYIGSTVRSPAVRILTEHPAPRRLRWAKVYIVELPTLSLADLQSVEGYGIAKWAPPSNRRRNAATLPPLDRVA